MPLMLSGDNRVDEHRARCHATWREHYRGPFPLVVILMNATDPSVADPFLSIPRSDVPVTILMTEEKYCTIVARNMLAHYLQRTGFTHLMWVDDDFSLSSGVTEAYTEAINHGLDFDRIWFISSRRMPFTSHKHKDMYQGRIIVVDGETKVMPKGIKLWRNDREWHNHFWTREGILFRVMDMQDAVVRMEDILGSQMYSYVMCHGEDPLTIAHVVMMHGMAVRRLRCVWHDLKKSREKENFTLTERPDLEMPINAIRAVTSDKYPYGDAKLLRDMTIAAPQLLEGLQVLKNE